MRTYIKNNKKFNEKLLNAKNERDVERAYIDEFERVGYVVESDQYQPCDGILKKNFKNECSPDYAIIEFKFDHNLKTREKRNEVIFQAMIYTYRIMKKSPYGAPPSCIIGDRNFCFIVETKNLIEFIQKYPSPDWEEGGIAPSAAYIERDDIFKKMNNDITIPNPLLFNITTSESKLEDLCVISENIYKNKKMETKITKSNMISIYIIFKNSVINLDNERKPNESDIDFDNRIVNIFFDILTDKDTTTKHENREDVMLNRGNAIHIFGQQYDSFKNIFCKSRYKNEELKELTSSKDMLLEEMKRRRTGAFFTPDLWIDKAHEMIVEQFGKDWKEKYVVWDCASGTNNLTRNYTFEELYNSTLERGDVNTVEDMKYPGVTFQYDFLNYNKNKRGLDASLIKALKQKKPLIFLINPPYGTAKSGSLVKGENKKDISNTDTNKDMKYDNIGACRQQLYAQFLYRIVKFKEQYELNNIKICVFSPPLFMTGEGYSTFRKLFYAQFDFKDGILFRANEFENDVSGEWGISFTLWDGK